jgi:hypothetical protein
VEFSTSTLDKVVVPRPPCTMLLRETLDVDPVVQLTLLCCKDFERTKLPKVSGGAKGWLVGNTWVAWSCDAPTSSRPRLWRYWCPRTTLQAWGGGHPGEQVIVAPERGHRPTVTAMPLNAQQM